MFTQPWTIPTAYFAPSVHLSSLIKALCYGPPPTRCETSFANSHGSHRMTSLNLPIVSRGNLYPRTATSTSQLPPPSASSERTSLQLPGPWAPPSQPASHILPQYCEVFCANQLLHSKLFESCLAKHLPKPIVHVKPRPYPIQHWAGSPEQLSPRPQANATHASSA